MSESTKLTNQIIDHIYRSGGYAWRAESSGVFDKKIGGYRTAPKKGVSDILGLYKGRLIAIEVKIGKDRLRTEQEGFLLNIAHYGGLTFVAKTLDSFIEWWDNEVEVR